MIWAILALLGVPIWLVVGALAGALISRRRFRSQPGVFPLLMREHGEAEWPRRCAYGRYVHDVLLVNSGLALVRTRVWAVDRVGPCALTAPIRKLVDPRCWLVTLDDGRQHELAVAADDAPRSWTPP